MTSPVKSLSVREDNDGAICIHKKVKAGMYESVSDFWFKIEKLVQFEKSLAGNSGYIFNVHKVMGDRSKYSYTVDI